jgi:hypothetical protein
MSDSEIIPVYESEYSDPRIHAAAQVFYESFMRDAAEQHWPPADESVKYAYLDRAKSAIAAADAAATRRWKLYGVSDNNQGGMWYETHAEGPEIRPGQNQVEVIEVLQIAQEPGSC